MSYNFPFLALSVTDKGILKFLVLYFLVINLSNPFIGIPFKLLFFPPILPTINFCELDFLLLIIELLLIFILFVLFET